jgi:hypothetical protein
VLEAVSFLTRFRVNFGEFPTYRAVRKADPALCTGGSRICVPFTNFTLPSDFIRFIVCVAKITVSHFIIFILLLSERLGI